MSYLKNTPTDIQALDVFVMTQLKRWQGSKKSPLGHDPVGVVMRVHKFGSSIGTDGFAAAVNKLSRTVQLQDVRSLNTVIADGLFHDMRGMDRDILSKSLHEALLYSTGVEIDLPLETFGLRFEEFLRQQGSKGFLRLFLSLHLFNGIWIRVQPRLQAKAPDEETFMESMRWIEWSCLSAVDFGLESWSHWPRLNPMRVERLIDAIEFHLNTRGKTCAA